MAKFTPSNKTFKLGIPDCHRNYIFAPHIQKWYRVIKRTKIQLVIATNGIEIPNAQCVYIQKHQFDITEKQAKQYPEDLYHDWKTARDNNLAARLDDTMPTVSLLGFNIDIENGQTYQYWFDHYTSRDSIHSVKQVHYVMKLLK